MSYIGTAKKNGINAVKALKAVFDGTLDIIFGQKLLIRYTKKNGSVQKSVGSPKISRSI